ncbi:DNA topoisomerase, partial [Candidatus Gracilibacteria bacterium]|nr:DNA topoisomerase [Candidatus Gracilibacteria bacterium]
MAKNLVIVESPTKAKIITNFLGKDYKVMSSNGHIRDLPAKKGDMTPKQAELPYSTLAVDIDGDLDMIFVNTPAKKKIIANIKAQIEPDTILWLASDEDREGEAISWHLLETLDPKRKLKNKRVVFHEITKGAIKEAFKNTRELDMDLVEAQMARRVLDRVVGYKLSPLLWKKIKFGLSAGRVQTPCTRILVDREREIQAFIPEEYWSIGAFFNKDKINFEAKIISDNGKKVDLKNSSDVEKILEKIGTKFVEKNGEIILD